MKLTIVLVFILCISLPFAQNDNAVNNEEDGKQIQQNAVFLTPEDFLGSENEDFRQKLFGNSSNNAQNYSALDPNKFEGDISIPGNRSIHSFVNDSNDVNRAAVRDQWRKWPNNEIPYVISGQYGSYSKQVLARAFDEYHRKTCIKFVPREDRHVDYIYIYPEDGCYSYVGRTNGRQTVSLDAGCMQFGTVLHELMHAVGFFHEQSRADRDDYVQIVWGNVRPDADTQFEKYSLRTITQLDLPYDYSSVMHYGPKTFSKNGRDTVVPLKSGASMMGQRRGFSYLDLKKLNKLYECDQIRVDPNDGVDSGGQSTNQNSAAPSGGGGTVRCENKKWTCFFWRWLGYCWRDKQWMLQYCPYTCDYCNEINIVDPDNNVDTNAGVKRFSTSGTPDDSSPSSESTANKIPPTAGQNCTDLHSHCRAWLKLGYCSSSRKDFQAFMNQQCPKTCGRCKSSDSSFAGSDDISFGKLPKSDTTICRDKLSVCKTYAFWNFCKAGNTKRGFMLENCQQSCNVC